MTDLAPSAIQGDTLPSPAGGMPLHFVFPQLLSSVGAAGLPRYWTPARDWVLAATVKQEAMWGSAIARTATKFAAHGYTVSDSDDSTRRVAAGQALLKRANGGEGWVIFAQKLLQDLLTTDNGVFIRIRRANDRTERVRAKAAGDNESFVEVTSSSPGGKITGLYHLDSLRCDRTGNLAYPVRYRPVNGAVQLLRWDQVLMYADQPSPRAELFGVGRCAASRAYPTIAKLAAMEQMVYEFLTGGGANKLAFLRGLNDRTLQDIIKAGQADAQMKGFLYYMGTILAAVPSDTDLTLTEVRLKELADGFSPKDERDNAYLIYANAIGVPVQDIQPLSGQGLGTGTQTVILEEAAQGIGLAAFLKWWEQTVSDRVLPATTELQFIDDHDVRDQKARAEVGKIRAETRAAQMASGEISPAMARQLAVDADDLPREFLATDATPGGQLSDDEKPLGEQASQNAAAQLLLASEPTQPPAQQPTVGMKDAAGHTGVM
ncbi:hypothetical protein SE17_16860, partial [Kouleothrix aurantiaca]